MKHQTVLLIAICLILVAPVVAAFTQNFQDGTGYTACVGVSCPLIQNSTGGNSYISTPSTLVKNSNSEQTTYASINLLHNAGVERPNIILYDSEMAPIYDTATPYWDHGRYEILISGGYANFYVDGIFKGASTPLSINPSYIGWGGISGTNYYDDLVYGSSAQRIVYGMPEDNVFIIKKDMLNSAAAGVSFKSNGTVVSSNYLTTTWSRSAIGETGGVNESIVLANVFSGTVYATKYTDSKNTSTEYWDIQTALINSGAPYGWYETYILNETGTHSIPINYIGTGASVSFDADTYSQGETATITHAVADGGYWNTGLYNYKLTILNGNTGQFIHNESIAVQSGTSTYTFTSSDTQGVYYAVVMATDLSTGSDVWMNYDWADVSAYITFNGTVYDAQTALPISGANVSITQGTITSNSITISDGNYTATGFLTGSTLTINATASGYSQYLISFVPMIAKKIPLNIILNSTTPTYSGLGIGGVARDGIISGSTITNGYGRPVTSATVFLKNTTNGEYYTTTTNATTGWYLYHEGDSVILITKRPYDLWGSKNGYSNSPNYTAVAA